MGEAITEEKLADMYEEANTYALLSHFFWGLWSVLQNDMSNIQFAFMVCYYNDPKFSDRQALAKSAGSTYFGIPSAHFGQFSLRKDLIG